MYKAGSLILLALTSCVQKEIPLSHPPGTKIFEARGLHQCQNDRMVGYTCQMFTGNILEFGCGTAHRTMMERHCCNSVVLNYEYPTTGKSIQYTALSCIQVSPPI